MQTSKRQASLRSQLSHGYVYVSTPQHREGLRGQEYSPPWRSLSCASGAVGAETTHAQQFCHTAAAHRPWQVCFRPILVLLCLLWIVALAMPAAAAKDESFWDIVLRIAGISANPGQLKGPGDEVEAGEVCVVNLEEPGVYRLRRARGFSTPIFGPKGAYILALKDHTLVRIPVNGGEVESLYTIPGSIKLVGFSMDDPDKMLVLIQDDEDSLSAGLLSLQSKQVMPITYDKQSAEDQLLLAHLQGGKECITIPGSTSSVKAKWVCQASRSGQMSIPSEETMTLSISAGVMAITVASPPSRMMAVRSSSYV